LPGKFLVLYILHIGQHGKPQPLLQYTGPSSDQNLTVNIVLIQGTTSWTCMTYPRYSWGDIQLPKIKS